MTYPYDYQPILNGTSWIAFIRKALIPGHNSRFEQIPFHPDMALFPGIPLEDYPQAVKGLIDTTRQHPWYRKPFCPHISALTSETLPHLCAWAAASTHTLTHHAHHLRDAYVTCCRESLTRIIEDIFHEDHKPILDLIRQDPDVKYDIHTLQQFMTPPPAPHTPPTNHWLSAVHTATSRRQVPTSAGG
jgi:hypothetical protein